MSRFLRTCRHLAVSSLLCAAGFAGAQTVDQRKIEKIDESATSTIPLAARHCARPFQHKGTIELGVGYSGSVGEFTTPDNGVLQVRSVRTTLRTAGLSASAIGTWANTKFAWQAMRVEAGVGRYASDRDEPVYADRSSLVKIEINRSGGNNTATTGDYELSGCLLNGIPQRVRLPDGQLPRLPPKVLTPLEPVETMKPAEKMKEVVPQARGR